MSWNGRMENLGWTPEKCEGSFSEVELIFSQYCHKKLAQQYVRHNILCMLRVSDITILNIQGACKVFLVASKVNLFLSSVGLLNIWYYQL